MRGTHPASIGFAERCLEISQRVHDVSSLLEAHQALGASLLYMGNPAPARDHLEQSLALYDPGQSAAHVVLYGRDPSVACASYLALTLWLLGYPDQALVQGDRARLLAGQVAHPFSSAIALGLTALLHQFRRDSRLAEESTETLAVLAAERSFPFWSIWVAIVRGWIRLMEGEGKEGIDQMREGHAAWQAMGAGLHWPWLLTLLAEAYGSVGEPEEGLTALDNVFPQVEKTGERYAEAELYRIKGELLLSVAIDNQAEAETCFHRARDIARKQRAVSWELRAAMSLARLWQRQGKRAQAYDLLSPVYEWFTEGFDTSDLQEARALLQEMPESRV